jgi:hypothetical protein
MPRQRCLSQPRQKEKDLEGGCLARHGQLLPSCKIAWGEDGEQVGRNGFRRDGDGQRDVQWRAEDFRHDDEPGGVV